MASIEDLRFDEVTWQKASEQRRQEWKLQVAELLDDGTLGDGLDGAYLLVTPTESSVLFEPLDEDGNVGHSVSLDASRSSPR